MKSLSIAQQSEPLRGSGFQELTPSTVEEWLYIERKENVQQRMVKDDIEVGEAKLSSEKYRSNELDINNEDK